MSISEFFSAVPEHTGRKYKELEHPFRSPFERDRDRILYSKEFRRLNRKTQVFISGFDDHVRNRLTHTIEVAQISQTIANHFELNEPLTLASADGHDVGHTPFGHVGERTLNYFMNGCFNYNSVYSKVIESNRGFKHNWQGIRVVTYLEKVSNDYDGLNLTNFTLWGILNHTGIKPKNCEFKNLDNEMCCYHRRMDKCIHPEIDNCFSFYKQYEKAIKPESWTIEALIVRMADEIAQRHHDLEDALFAKIIDKNEIIQILNQLFGEQMFPNANSLKKLKDENNLNIFIHSLSTIIINYLVNRLIEQTEINLNMIISQYSITSSEDFHIRKIHIIDSLESLGLSIFDLVNYPTLIVEKEAKLQHFLKNRILNSNIAQSMDGKSSYILRRLIYAYLDNPQQLPDGTIIILYRRYLSKTNLIKFKTKKGELNVGKLREELKNDHFNKNIEPYRTVLMRIICDFIAGMTDDFAIAQYNKLYGTTNVFNNHV